MNIFAWLNNVEFLVFKTAITDLFRIHSER